MKEYLFYFNETDPRKTETDGSYIWYFKTKATTLTEALAAFVEFVGNDEQIIQVIVKSALQ
jgi:hypothetical protein